MGINKKKTILRIETIYQDLIYNSRLLWLRLNNLSIKISSTTKIYYGCSIKTNYGGKITIGNYCEVLYGVCLMTYGGIIQIGNNCSINPYTIIYGHGKGVIIGNNVLIAAHTIIIPSNHIFKNLNIPINQQGENSKGIVIEDNVWIGAGCKILDGVRVEFGAIIAAGTVVNKNVPRNAIVAGVPGKVIKYRDEI